MRSDNRERIPTDAGLRRGAARRSGRRARANQAWSGGTARDAAHPPDIPASLGLPCVPPALRHRLRRCGDHRHGSPPPAQRPHQPGLPPWGLTGCQFQRRIDGLPSCGQPVRDRSTSGAACPAPMWPSPRRSRAPPTLSSAATKETADVGRGLPPLAVPTPHPHRARRVSGRRRSIRRAVLCSAKQVHCSVKQV